MNNCAVAVILFLLLVGDAHASSLVIAAEDAAAPWSYPDGTGYANEVVHEAYRAVGIDVTFKVVPYARCKHLVIGGDVTACLSMSPEKGLEKKVTLSERPLFIVNYDYFHNINKPLKAKKVDEIPKGTRVGVVTAYEYPASSLQLINKGVIFQASNDEETNLRKLVLGRIDVAIITQNEIKPASLMIDKLRAPGTVKLLLRSGTMGSYIGFSKTNPQGDFACKQFNNGYRIIQRNGTLQRLKDKWTDRIKNQ